MTTFAQGWAVKGENNTRAKNFMCSTSYKDLVIIKNVPNIRDVNILINLLKIWRLRLIKHLIIADLKLKK